MSTGKLEDFLPRFSEYVDNERRDRQVPGMAAAVVHEGEMIWAAGFGHCSPEARIQVSPQTMFAIGSSTKAFTTTGVAMLVDEGELDWDGRLGNYIPGFTMKDSLAGQRLTLRDMACHRSGLPRYDLSLFNPELSREDLVSALEHLEANRDFRTTWQYQNLMYAALGYLVGRVSGSSWEEFTREKILDPLKMARSNFSLEALQDEPEYAVPCGRNDGEVIELPWVEIGPTGPAGSINSTVEEMANWLLFNLDAGEFGGKQLLAGEGIRRLHTPHMVLSDNPKHPEIMFRSYGLGWFTESYRGVPLIHHGGNTVGFTASVSFMPDHDVGVVILSNMSQDWLPQALSYRVYDHVLGLDAVDWSGRFSKESERARDAMKEGREKFRLGKQADTSPSHDLEEYTGTYEHPGLGKITVALNDDGELRARYGLLNIALTHHHYDAFEAELDLWFDTYSVLARFDTDKHTGKIINYQMPFGFETGLKETVFKRVPERVTVSEGLLEAYAGEYELKAAAVTITVSRRDDSLVVTVPGQQAMEMIPISETRFEASGLEGVYVEFTEVCGGQPVQLVITQPGGSFEAVRTDRGE